METVIRDLQGNPIPKYIKEVVIHRYKHFKGKEYFLYGAGVCYSEQAFYAIYGSEPKHDGIAQKWCRHSETEHPYWISPSNELIPLYIADLETGRNSVVEQQIIQAAAENKLWIRPLEMFFGYTEVDGKKIRRFERI